MPVIDPSAESIMSSPEDLKLQEIAAAFDPWRRSHRRDAWRPLTEESTGSGRRSQFGGIALLGIGEPWPACTGCQRPMQLFLQLDLASLPESCPLRHERGILQLFYCVADPDADDLCECDQEMWQPLSPGKLARVLDIDTHGAATPVVPAGFAPFPARVITAWEHFDDYPSTAEHEELGIGYEYEFRPGRTFTTVEWREGGVQFDRVPTHNDGAGVAEAISTAAEKDKLGGWPMWVQGVEYPRCPQCNQLMSYLFQIDSEDHVPYMFGDAGCGHLTRCEQHPEVLGFGWACC
jgi:hypothetical protein